MANPVVLADELVHAAVRARALVVGLGLFAVGERAQPLVARERLPAARKIAVLRVPGRVSISKPPFVVSPATVTWRAPAAAALSWASIVDPRRAMTTTPGDRAIGRRCRRGLLSMLPFEGDEAPPNSQPLDGAPARRRLRRLSRVAGRSAEVWHAYKHRAAPGRTAVDMNTTLQEIALDVMPQQDGIPVAEHPL
jgi:hypothetical protein